MGSDPQSNVPGAHFLERLEATRHRECRAEIERLKAEVGNMRMRFCDEHASCACCYPDSCVICAAHKLKGENQRLTDFMRRNGYRPCDIAACNCNEWHNESISRLIDEKRAAKTALKTAREETERLDWLSNWRHWPWGNGLPKGITTLRAALDAARKGGSNDSR